MSVLVGKMVKDECFELFTPPSLSENVFKAEIWSGVLGQHDLLYMLI